MRLRLTEDDFMALLLITIALLALIANIQLTPIIIRNFWAIISILSLVTGLLLGREKTRKYGYGVGIFTIILIVL